MMKIKTTGIIFICLVCVSLFSVKACASETQDELWLNGVWESIDSDTEDLFDKLGIDKTAESFLNISPSSVINLIVGIFKGEISSPLKNSASVLLIIFAVSVVISFLPKGKMSELAETVGMMFIIFALLAFSGEIISECRSALSVSKNFMLSLIPALAGVVAFSGNPTLALSFNTVAFSFCEGVSVFLINYMPALSSIGTGIAAAGALNPVMKLSGVCKLFNKAVTIAMSFVSSIFVAVLSIRGVIAGAADTVTVKGMRFLINNTIPVVGSAIGDALNSVLAGLGLIKHTLGVLGITALIFMTLPSFIRLILWKFSLIFLGVVCDVLENSRIKAFIESLNGVLSVLMGVMCFNLFVYIISIAIIITIGNK